MAISKRKNYEISFKLRAVKLAEDTSKEGAARVLKVESSRVVLAKRKIDGAEEDRQITTKAIY